jgi:SAM-dependent methyltransferase
MVFSYGISIGIRSLFHGYFSRESLKNVIVPVNYWRMLEYRLVVDELRPGGSDRILDIGSPKLLSLYLAEKCGGEIYATDIEEYFVSDYEYYRTLRRIPKERYRVLQADGRNLQFMDGFFDKVYSISVLEHIPDDGDSRCMREIARVLKPGGVCVATVPFAPKSIDEYRPAAEFYWSAVSGDTKEKGNSFFQRRYSEMDLHTRLVAPSGLTVRRIGYMGERFALGGRKEIANYLPPFTGPIQPLASRIFHVGPTVSWHEIPNPLGAILVLTKE